MPTKGGYTALVGILEELEIVELAASTLETSEDIDPSALVLVAVGELDVSLGKVGTRSVKLFEADDGDVCGKLLPRVVRSQLAAGSERE